MWHCKSTDPKGEVLENILSELNMHVLNSSKCTYNRGKSVLDLSICSNSIRKYFESHQVLDFKISDHQPTMTTFNNINSEPKRFKTKKINWQKFNQTLANLEHTKELKNEADIDMELSQLTYLINSTVEKCTSTIHFSCKAVNPKPIPKHLNDKDLANAFGAKLETIFNPSTQIEIPNPSRTHANSPRDEKKNLRDALIDRQEIMKALALTNPKSAPGLDKKDKPPDDLNSYRPISLISCLSK
ncbi:hypothetical protein BpHYR1_043464, partial [Brachionus plicatilis]